MKCSLFYKKICEFKGRTDILILITFSWVTLPLLGWVPQSKSIALRTIRLSLHPEMKVTPHSTLHLLIFRFLPKEQTVRKLQLSRCLQEEHLPQQHLSRCISLAAYLEWSATENGVVWKRNQVRLFAYLPNIHDPKPDPDSCGYFRKVLVL